MCKNIIYLILGFIAAAQAGFKMQGQPVYLAGDQQQPYQKPLWSGDGRYLAFSGHQFQGVYVLRLSDRHLSQLSDEPAAGYGLVWSNDSKSLASRVAQYEGMHRYNALKLFDVETLKAQLLCSYQTAALSLPVFSSDDSRLYSVNRQALQAYPTGKPVSTLNKTAPRPLAYVLSDRLMIMNASGVSTPLLKDQRILNLTSSRDGQWLAFEIMGGPLCVIRSDGSGYRELGTGYRPHFSPDGKHLVFMVTRDDGHDYLASDLYIMAIDGSERLALTTSTDKLEMNPCWSPDGRQIAYDVLNEGAVYIVNLAAE